MKCNIKFNDSGKITKVLDSQGRESRLFNKLARFPLNSVEESLEIYKQVVESNELFFESNSVEFDTYEEALKNSQGNDIFLKDENGNILKTVSSNTSPNTRVGLINNAIKNNILSDTNIFQEGESFLQPKGYDDLLQSINTEIFKDFSAENGYNTTAKKDGRILLSEGADTSIRNNTYSEAIKTMDEDVAVTSLGFAGIIDSIVHMRKNVRRNTVTEATVINNIKEVFKKAGFSLTTINKYVENYTIKNGVAPSAEALIDIQNKIVAFAEGRENLDNLSEEFAHFVLESLDTAEVEVALRLVHRTKEYTEFQAQYREAYSKQGLEGLALEDRVRREILGKIVSKGALNNLHPQTQNIFEYIIDKIKQFMNSLGLTSNQTFKSASENLAKVVSDMIVTKDISALSQNTNTNGFVYYSLNTQPSTPQIGEIHDLLKITLRTLQDQEKFLKKRGMTASIQDVLDKIAQVETQSSLLATVDFINKQLSYVEKALESARVSGEVISSEEAVVLQSLKTDVLPTLVTMSEIVKKDNTLRPLLSNLSQVKLRITDLKTTPSSEVMDRIIKKTISRYQLPSEFELNGEKVQTYDYFKEAITAVSSDTNFLYAYIGQVSHAKEPLLNMLDSVVFNMVQTSHRRFFEASKTFQNELKALGVKEKDLTKFFDKGGHILSIFDYSKYESDKINILAESFFNKLKEQKDFKGETMTLTKEQIVETLTRGSQFKEEDRLEGTFKDEYSKEVSEKLVELRERQYEDAYYEERQKELDDLNLPTEALNKIKQLGFDRADIMSRVDLSNGYPVMSLQDKYDLDTYNTERVRSKSPYDSSGNIKSGLTVLTEIEFENAFPNEYEKGKFIYDNGFVKNGSNYFKLDTNASPEAKIAYGISKLDGNFIDKNKNTVRDSGLTPKFIEQLRNIENTQGREAAYNFFLANTNIGMEDSFYEQPFEDVFREHYDSGNASDDFLGYYERYQKVSIQRREILKHYKDSKSTMNTLASRMSNETMQQVKDLSEELNDIRKAMYSEVDAEESTLDPITENTVNEDYKGQLRDLGIENNKKERLAFAMKHAIGVNNFSTAFSTLDYLKIGKEPSPFLRNLLDRYLKSLGVDSETIAEDIKSILENDSLTLAEKTSQIEDYIDTYKLEIVERRLAPYFKSMSPIGVSSLFSEMAGASPYSRSVSQIVEVLPTFGVKLTLHNSYYTANLNNAQENKSYKKGFLASQEQPKASLYTNKEFESKLGVKIKRDANGNMIFDEFGIPEVKNETNLFKAYKAMVEYHKGSLEATGELGRHNLYTAPQVSRTNMDKIITSITQRGQVKEIAKEFVKEMTTFRVDEQEQGQTGEDGQSLFIKTGLRVVPKRYFTKLESAQDVSDDLFYSITLMRQEAELHKARKQALTEVTALEEAIASKKFTNGKSAESSSTYKMAKSYIDYNIYGISEIVNFKTTLPLLGEVDVAKVARLFHKYIRFKNLAWNLVIPMTSWLTAETNIQLERHIGQFIDANSLAEARKETLKLGKESALEAFNVHSVGRLNVIGQYFNVYDLDATYANAKMGKIPIMLSRLSMGAHTLGNYSPIAQAMLAHLYNRRVYAGRVVTRKEFNQAYTLNNPNATAKEVENSWRDLKDKTLYHYMNTEIDKGKVTLEFDKLATDMGAVNDEAFRASIEDMMTAVAGNTKKFIERIDGNIPQHEKTILQRSFFGSFLMTHKGWLSIGVTNRFKRAHYNIQTNQVEEGSYITLARKTRMVTDGLIDAIKKKDFNSFFQLVKNIYKDGTEIEKTNLKRIALDQAMLFTIYGMVLMLSAFADDDENKDLYLAQMSAYLMERVFNETKSSQFGILGELTNTVKAPVVGFENLLGTLDITRALDFDPVKSGNYAGMTKSNKYFIDAVPGYKSFYSIYSAENIAKQRRSYEHFNSKDDFNIASLMFTSKEFREFLQGQ